MSQFLEVYGAKTHNLKNVNVKIPKNKMVIITGVSGSGKSSLAFNTIYNVGQQKYLESLSSYARMFIGKQSEEAEVDEIVGLSPTISIDQKTTNRNPRSTVGTITEIYDYYKLLYLNIGERKCIKCGSMIKKDTVEDVLGYISNLPEGTKFTINAPFEKNCSDDAETMKTEILQSGFIRYQIGEKVYTINDTITDKEVLGKDIDIVVDRQVVNKEIATNKRLTDSIELAFRTGENKINIVVYGEKHHTEGFSSVFVCSHCGHIPEELSISSFSFNSHAGACEDCHGLGIQSVFLEEKIIKSNLSIEEGAILAPGFNAFYTSFLQGVGEKEGFRTDVPWETYSQKTKDLILYGNGKKYFVDHTNNGKRFQYESTLEGLVNTLKRRFFDGGKEKRHYKNFVEEIECPSCDGARLKQETLSVYIQGCNIGVLLDKSVDEALEFFSQLKLTDTEQHKVKKVLKNILERLEFLVGVGLSYMTLSRRANTISGGESQRIRLATQIGVKLEGIIYVLDEPSIGLHPRDNMMLIENLKKLRDIGNTLIIVEHDEDIMRESDHIIDIGPQAGVHGGQIVAEGTLEEIIKNKKSPTAPYLSGEKNIIIDKGDRQVDKFLSIIGAEQNNLKNIDVHFPLGNMTVVTGVSGSGKSSLVNDILSRYLLNELNRASKNIGKHKEITGTENFDKALVIDQSPIGKTPRSNPATYTGVFTHIREVFAKTYEAEIRGYGPGRFSFNTKDGRCEECEGDGVKKVEMHFLAPVYVNCESCHGQRFNPETLKIKYKGKNIFEVLNMTVEEASGFFEKHPKIRKILQTMENVGLGYIKLGQSSTTLSGGESQRLKLSTELSKRSTKKTVYILDEPTTGLHFQDIEKLLKILHGLVDRGNTVIVIEHNMNVIMNADYIIDIGPEGGDLGGTLVGAGTVEEITKIKDSYTGKAIKKYMKLGN